MSIFSYKQRNDLVLVVLIILAGLIFFSLKGLFTAFLGAIVIYTLFKPVYLFLSTKMIRALSATIVIVTSFIIIILPFFVLSYMVINKVSKLKNDQFQLKALISRLDDMIGLKFNQPNLIDGYIDKLILVAQDLFPTLVGEVLHIFLIIVVMYFVLFFMLVQSETFESAVFKYAPLREHHAKQFGEELRNTTYSNILGQGLIAIIQGMLVSIAFFLVGIDDAIFWGIISVFISFLPIIGAPVVTLPASLILYLNGESWQAGFLFFFTLLVLINIDNVIRFIINKRLADTHPVVTVIGVVIGIPLFGFVGIVFGPLLLSWFWHLILIYETDKIAAERLEQQLQNKNSEE